MHDSSAQRPRAIGPVRNAPPGGLTLLRSPSGAPPTHFSRYSFGTTAEMSSSGLPMPRSTGEVPDMRGRYATRKSKGWLGDKPTNHKLPPPWPSPTARSSALSYAASRTASLRRRCAPRSPRHPWISASHGLSTVRPAAADTAAPSQVTPPHSLCSVLCGHTAQHSASGGDRCARLALQCSARRQPTWCRPTELPADEAMPDCVFVEDPVVVGGATALLCNPGHSSRAGEGEQIGKALRVRGPIRAA